MIVFANISVFTDIINMERKRQRFLSALVWEAANLY